VKKSGHAFARFRRLLVGLALGVCAGLLVVSGCSLGPKQDDPAVPTVTDTGLGGGGVDTSTGGADVAAAPDGVASDTYDPGTGLDGCKGAGVDGGDAVARDGEIGCEGGVVDAAPDGDASDARDGKDEGDSDVATGD
jgi:hypothetical protein